jgi:hypothetical protein
MTAHAATGNNHHKRRQHNRIPALIGYSPQQGDHSTDPGQPWPPILQAIRIATARGPPTAIPNSTGHSFHNGYSSVAILLIIGTPMKRSCCTASLPAYPTRRAGTRP